MSETMTLTRRAPRYFFVASLASLLAASCAPRSILGSADDDVVADSARHDVVRPMDLGVDVQTPDVASDDTVTADAPDVMAADAMDASVALDVVTADAIDAADVTDATDATDITDVLDAGPTSPGILGTAAQFTILAGSTVSNTGLSTIAGEVGVSPGLALVGIPSGTVVHAGDPVAALAQSDTTVAYNYLAGLPCGTELTGLDLGGMTLAPGVYCFTSSAALTGTVVLDGQNQPNPLFVFQIASTLVTANVAAVVTINGARPCDVYWQTGSSATVGIASNFSGNIISLGSVTLNTGATLNGRALARTGGVTMDTNSVSNASCPDPSPPTDAGAGDASTDAPMDAHDDVPADAVDGG